MEFRAMLADRGCVAAADAGGLKGQERIDFIVTESGLNANADARKIRKIIEVARQHLGLPLRTDGD